MGHVSIDMVGSKLPMELDEWLFDLETGKAKVRFRGQYAAIDRVRFKYARRNELSGRRTFPPRCRERSKPQFPPRR